MLKIDLHVHSTRSDGISTPREIIRYAKKIGLAGIAFTDHDVMPPHITDPELLIIPGVEVSTKQGHVLLYGVYEIPKPKIDIFELVDFAKERDYVLVPAHPYDIFRSGIGKLVEKIPSTAIEVINGGNLLSYFNKKAFRIAKKLNKPMTGGSDAHITDLVGIAYTVFLDPIDNVDDALYSIRKGSIYPEGKTFGIFPKIKRFIVKNLGLRKFSSDEVD